MSKLKWNKINKNSTRGTQAGSPAISQILRPSARYFCESRKRAAISKSELWDAVENAKSFARVWVSGQMIRRQLEALHWEKCEETLINKLKRIKYNNLIVGFKVYIRNVISLHLFKNLHLFCTFKLSPKYHSWPLFFSKSNITFNWINLEFC